MLDEEQLSRGLASGDPTAAAALLERDLGVTLFAASVLSPGTDPLDAVERAFAGTAARPPAAGQVRAALLTHLLAALGHQVVPPEGGAAVTDGFADDDDRWAGWWVDDVVSWPAGHRPGAGPLAAALRSLPMPLRVILLLVDAAQLPPGTAAGVLSCAEAQLEGWLEAARGALVAALDATTGTTTGTTTVGTGTSEGLSCS
jgi:hypothetical protein